MDDRKYLQDSRFDCRSLPNDLRHQRNLESRDERVEFQINSKKMAEDPPVGFGERNSKKGKSRLIDFLRISDQSAIRDYSAK